MVHLRDKHEFSGKVCPVLTQRKGSLHTRPSLQKFFTKRKRSTVPVGRSTCLFTSPPFPPKPVEKHQTLFVLGSSLLFVVDEVVGGPVFLDEVRIGLSEKQHTSLFPVTVGTGSR